MNDLNILFIGDVCGRPGREAVKEMLPKLKASDRVDLVIANAENSAAGIGITNKHVIELANYGVDLITLGDHAFRVKNFDIEATEIPVIRPANFTLTKPGAGWSIVEVKGKRVGVINLIGRVFMERTEAINPFHYLDKILKEPKIEECDIRIVDFHAEATSEKIGLAYDNISKVDAILGTHTHIPTADQRIIKGKLAFVTDVGQTGPAEACLWVKPEIVVNNFKYPDRMPQKIQLEGSKMFSSVLISFKNNSPVSIERRDFILEN